MHDPNKEFYAAKFLEVNNLFKQVFVFKQQFTSRNTKVLKEFLASGISISFINATYKLYIFLRHTNSYNFVCQIG